MHIDRQLQLVIELSRGKEQPPLFVHSTALPVDVFEQYFDLCGPTMNTLVAGGYGFFAPRYAALVFRQTARRAIPAALVKDEDAYRRAEAAVEARIAGFYNELHRLTFVVALKDGRWDTMPIDDAKGIGAISDEEYSRIDATLVFFTCASESVPPEDRESVAGGLSLFNARTESLSCTEFATSLQTSMKAANSGARADASPRASHGSQAMPASDNTSSASTNPASHGAHQRRTGIGITVQRPPA